MRGANASSNSGSALKRLCVLGKLTQISGLGAWVMLGPAGPLFRIGGGRSPKQGPSV